MQKTNLQKQIETMNHVSTPLDTQSTFYIMKQNLYNDLFHAKKYFPTYEPKPHDTKFDLLVGYNIHKAITVSALKKLESKGNLVAHDLLVNTNKVVSMEDLAQEVLLIFCERSKDWEIDKAGKVTINEDSEVLYLAYRVVSTTMYQSATKHYKHQYIEIDGNIVDVNKVTDLADYVSIDNIMNNVHFATFYNAQSTLDKQWLDNRLLGLSNSEIARILNVTYEKIRACEKRVRRLWNEYNK